MLDVFKGKQDVHRGIWIPGCPVKLGERLLVYLAENIFVKDGSSGLLKLFLDFDTHQLGGIKQ
jgi:hypothetical protein